jgi:membrane-associated protein
MLLGFLSGYSCLFLLSVVFLMPHYASSEIGGFLLPLLTEDEPEVRLVASFLLPLLWILIPLTSIVLCVFSWVAYSVSLKMIRPLQELINAGGTVLLAVSIFPALLVARQLLVYLPLGLTGAFLTVLHTLNGFLFASGSLVNPTLILRWGGTWGVPAVIFVETGLFFGFFLPGDSLLVAAGVLGSAGEVNLILLIPLTALAAIAGDQLNYLIGHRSGEALASRFRFIRMNLERARAFYAKHGGKAILLARFVPVIRTFAPAVAGAARMNYLRFVLYNIAGGVLWVMSMTLAGYFVGSIIPKITEYLDLVIAVVIVTSVLPSILLWVLRRRPAQSAP